MTLSNFGVVNDGRLTLEVAITETDLTALLDGKYGRLPNGSQLTVMKITEKDISGNIIARENILVTNRTGNQITFTRAYEPVAIDDDATTLTQQALPFSAGSTIEVVFSKKLYDNMMDELKRISTQVSNFIASLIAPTSTGSANAYVVTLTTNDTGYVTGQTYSFISNFANTGASTVNYNSWGAISIKKLQDQDLESGDIESGQVIEVRYDGTVMELVSQIAKTPTPQVEKITKTVILGENITNNRCYRYGNINIADVTSTPNTVTQNTGGNSYFLGNASATFAIGQGVVAGKNGIPKIEIYARNGAGTTNSFWLEIYSNATFTTKIGTSREIYYQTGLSGSFSLCSFTFDSTNVVNGTTYYIKAVPAFVSGGNYILLEYTNTNPYAGGILYQITDANVVSTTAYDLRFTFSVYDPEDITKVYTSSSIDVLRAVVDGFLGVGGSKGDTITSNTGGDIDTLTGLTPNGILFLQLNGSLAHTPATLIKVVGFARTTTLAFLNICSRGIERNVVFTTKNLADATGATTVVAHGLGRIPKLAEILSYFNGTPGAWLSQGSYDGIKNECMSVYYTSTPTQSVTFAVKIDSTGAGTAYQTGVITWDSTNITITWTKTGTPTGTAYLRLLIS